MLCLSGHKEVGTSDVENIQFWQTVYTLVAKHSIVAELFIL